MDNQEIHIFFCCFWCKEFGNLEIHVVGKFRSASLVMIYNFILENSSNIYCHEWRNGKANSNGQVDKENNGGIWLYRVGLG